MYEDVVLIGGEVRCMRVGLGDGHSCEAIVKAVVGGCA